MYAVIRTGGKQARVVAGERVLVERTGSTVGADVTFEPLLLVDGETVLSTPDELRGASVAGRIVADTKGPKITGFTYKPKSRSRRRFGHRQHYHTVEITGISTPSARSEEA